VGSGTTIPRALAAIADRGDGPLSEELGRTVAAIESGTPAEAALAELGVRAGVGELALAGRAMARSHRLGAPVGDELRAQSAALRREHARAVREAADRAAPKIQLVVALVLVPAVLLIIAAALIAHAESLLLGI
jgi:tight adherence protein C